MRVIKEQFFYTRHLAGELDTAVKVILPNEIEGLSLFPGTSRLFQFL